MIRVGLKATGFQRRAGKRICQHTLYFSSSLTASLQSILCHCYWKKNLKHFHTWSLVASQVINIRNSPRLKNTPPPISFTRNKTFWISSQVKLPCQRRPQGKLPPAILSFINPQGTPERPEIEQGSPSTLRRRPGTQSSSVSHPTKPDRRGGNPLQTPLFHANHTPGGRPPRPPQHDLLYTRIPHHHPGLHQASQPPLPGSREEPRPCPAPLPSWFLGCFFFFTRSCSRGLAAPPPSAPASPWRSPARPRPVPGPGAGGSGAGRAPPLPPSPGNRRHGEGLPPPPPPTRPWAAVSLSSAGRGTWRVPSCHTAKSWKLVSGAASVLRTQQKNPTFYISAAPLF